jgi:hypothetical protein
MTHDPQQPPGEDPLGQGPSGNSEPPQQRGSGSRSRGSDRQDKQEGEDTRRTSGPQHGSHAVGREPKEHKSHLGMFVALGIIGLLALGGLIGGLVAAFGGSSSTAAVHHPSVPTHVPTPAAHSTSSTSSGHLIKTFQYIGPRTSGGFTVPTSAVASHYIYRCPSGPGPFDATMKNASGSDIQTVAKTSGPGGTGATVLHAKHPGQAYHLDVNTKCEYRIQLYTK